VDAAILMYHHIGALPENADDIRIGLTVSTDEFSSQVKYLADHDYIFLTLGALEKAIEDKKVPEKVAVLTFDDGYDDNYYEALPVLKKYKAVGTFFIITSKIDQSEYLTRDQILALQDAGNEIGSHTIDHLNMTNLHGASLDQQLTGSKSTLEELTGKTVNSFCYPAGKYNDKTVEAVSNAGYKIAVTTHSASGQIDINNLFELDRYRISANRSFEALFR